MRKLFLLCGCRLLAFGSNDAVFHDRPFSFVIASCLYWLFLFVVGLLLWLTLSAFGLDMSPIG